MSALKLRPCPFCGKEAKTYHAFPEFEQGWTIDCDHDDECILRVAHGMFACEETEERAADTWNRRADMPPGYVILSPDEVRAIRDAAKAEGRSEALEECFALLQSKANNADERVAGFIRKLSGELKGRKQSARWNSEKNHYSHIAIYYRKAAAAIRSLKGGRDA